MLSCCEDGNEHEVSVNLGIGCLRDYNFVKRNTAPWKQPYLGAFAKLRKATISFVVSVCLFVRPSTWNNSAPSERIFMKLCIREFFENLSTKMKFH